MQQDDTYSYVRPLHPPAPRITSLVAPVNLDLVPSRVNHFWHTTQFQWETVARDDCGVGPPLHLHLQRTSSLTLWSARTREC